MPFKTRDKNIAIGFIVVDDQNTRRIMHEDRTWLSII
jgi:hypothetical protein